MADIGHRTPRTDVIDEASRPAVLDRLVLGNLWRLHAIEEDRRLSAGAALIVDAGTVVLASTDERARLLGRLQFEEGTGSGPSCLAAGRPSRAAPAPASELARLERQLGISHRLSVPIGTASEQPPAILTCWSSNGEVDEELAAMTAMDVASLVQRARVMLDDVHRAAAMSARLGGDDDTVAIAIGILMESADLPADQAERRLRRRALAAGRSVEDEADAIVSDGHRPAAADR